MTTKVRWKGRTLSLGNQSEGVRVEYKKISMMLRIGGWYDGWTDGAVGIEAQEVSLAEFLRGLGITLRDCTEALARKGGTNG